MKLGQNGQRPRLARRPASLSLRLNGYRPVAFPAIMGVLNVTPDSFSDGGLYFDTARAVERALQMAAEGAAIIDIGGESTRPGAREVPVAAELNRVIPVIREVLRRSNAVISIDTRKAAVAKAALAEGAAIVNDVSAMTFDVAMAKVVAESGAAVILMHMRGTPETMMRRARYGSVAVEVSSYLKQRAQAALKAGVASSRILVDPGIGFAKNLRHNLELIAALPRLCRLGYPLAIGISRKSFLRRLVGEGTQEVLLATAAAAAVAVFQGAAIIRVHDPKPIETILKIAESVRRARS